MKSIRRHMVMTVGLAGLALLVLGGFLFYFVLRQALLARFDSELATKAQALAKASEIDDGEFEIDLKIAEFAGFGLPTSGDFFEITKPDGTLVERSPSLGSAALVVPAQESPTPGYLDLVLPDGRPGRAYRQIFSPAAEDNPDERSLPMNVEALQAYRDLQMIVASDLTELRQTLGIAAFSILGAGLAISLLAIGTMHFVFGAAFRPLDRIASSVQSIGPQDLHRRISAADLPSELQGVAGKINELLERLQASFARERRFTSDAAHELRSPLAELKTMAELVARWPDDFTPEHASEMVNVVDEMEALLAKLFQLATVESGGRPAIESIDLAATVRECIARLQPPIDSRQLRLDVKVEEGAFSTDPVLWRSIVGNLVANSVTYAPEGSLITVEASPRRFAVTNDAPDLTPQDLPNLFDRFWRKSAARSERRHAGLGLPFVKTAVEFLRGTCRTGLRDGRLSVIVDWKP